MITLPVDLHIHSCLSPCAEEDMTPNNIAAMASLKGLAAIAVCDHNSCLNAFACSRAGEHFGVTVVPGVEATTAEDIHVLCYFAQIAMLEEFCALMDSRRTMIKNKPDLLGNQIIMDEDDNIIGEWPHWLGQATGFSIDEMELEARSRGGVLVPAHINRPSQSLLANLGFIPPALKARTMEIRGDYVLPEGYHPIRSSDAHSLGEILEDGFLLTAEDASVDGIIRALLA